MPDNVLITMCSGNCRLPPTTALKCKLYQPAATFIPFFFRETCIIDETNILQAFLFRILRPHET